MDNLDPREWLLTNSLGSFATGTVSDARTRTYHGWLIAALNPPSQRTLLLSHLEASLEVASKVVALSTNFWSSGTVEPTGYKLLQSFEIEPIPTWIWGQDNWQLSRQLVMPYGIKGSGVREQGEPVRCGGSQGNFGMRDLRADTLSANSLGNNYGRNLPFRCRNWRSEGRNETEFCNRILIQYCYEGSDMAILRLRPMICDRDFHHQQKAQPDLQFSQLVGQQQIYLQAFRPGQVGTQWQLRWTQGDYQADHMWYWDYSLPEETLRGLGDCEDLYNPGYLTITLQPGTTLTLEARVGWTDSQFLSSLDFEQAVQIEQERLHQFAHLTQIPASVGQAAIWQRLLRAGDQFIVYRASIAGPTVIAGYPWFNDWGRDTLIALPGLALTTQRFDLARGLLQTFGRYCRYGLIPNAFPDAGAEPFYNSIDAALWWIETLGLYLEATQDWDFLAEQYPVVQQIYKAFTTGTKYNIQVDAADGLLSWDAPDVALTWMDAVVGGQPVTLRRGKPVEINALWYSALCWAGNWAERLSRPDATRQYAQQAKQVRESLQKFWNPTTAYLYDTIEPDNRPNAQIRPNAVLALSLYHCGFPPDQARQVIQRAISSLLTPYGLRSLDADDPEYIGNYTGDSQHRDQAYHQGTVWSWLIGPFIRAWQRFYDLEPVPFNRQPLIDHFLDQACLGSISEIFDGDPPHAPQGAIAQAWSVAELIRHWSDL